MADRPDVLILEALDRAISDVAAGRPAGRTAFPELEESLLATVASVAAGFRAVRPAPAFGANLEAHLAATPLPHRRFDRERQGSSRLGGSPAAPMPAPRRLFRAAWSQLAMAALVLLTLVGAWFSLGPDRRENGGATQLRVQSPIWEPGDDFAGVVTWLRVRLEPGTFYTDLLWGPGVFLVERGQISFTSMLDGPPRQIVAGGVVNSSSRSTVRLENTGDEPAVIVLAVLAHEEPWNTPPYLNPGVTVQELLSPRFVGASGVPWAIALREITLDARQRIDTWRTRGQTWMSVQSGSVGITPRGDPLPANLTDGLESTFDRWWPIPVEAGIELSIRNASDSTARLFVLELMPEPQWDQ
jgi:hypothetical protein